MNKLRPLVFVHVPKTAGTTFHQVLKREYVNRYFINAFNVDESLRKFKSLSEFERQSIELVQGHSALYFVEYLTNPVLITFLRNPIDLVVSNFYYIKRAPWNGYHKYVNEMSSIMEFVEFTKEKKFDNLQTRHLSKVDLKNSNEIDRSIHRIEDLYDITLSNLKRFDFVFTIDEFDKALLTLRKSLNWKKIPVYTKQNKTEKRISVKELDDETKKVIADLNSFDLKLYNLAKDIKNLSVDEEVLKQFKALNKKYQNSTKLYRWFFDLKNRLK